MPAPLRQPLLQWLIYGHVWLALAVVVQIQWTGLFLHEAPDLWRYTLAAAFGTFAGYAVMRLARLNGPEAERYQNLVWYRARRKLMAVLASAASLIAFVLMWPQWGALWHWLLPVIAMAALYLTPFTTINGHGLGLRSIPLLKGLLIPAVWVVVVAAVPMRLDAYEHSVSAILMYACMRAPLILALCIVFDIRDHTTDDPALRTVPILVGVRGAKIIAVLTLLCAAAFESAFLRGLGYGTASLTVLIGYVVAVLLALRARPVRDPVYYALYVDGMMILIPVCGWIGTLL